MCAAAHGWVGLGRIVYAASSRQLVTWVAELGMPPSPVRTLAIEDVVPGLTVHGPVGTGRWTLPARRPGDSRCWASTSAHPEIRHQGARS
jgi:hypothetical protein